MWYGSELELEKRSSSAGSHVWILLPLAPSWSWHLALGPGSLSLCISSRITLCSSWGLESLLSFWTL